MEKRAAHQGLCVATSHVEEHEVGWGVVEEGRQDTRHPEITCINRISGSIVHQRNQGGKMPGFTGTQDGQHGGDGDKNTEKQFADLENRIPVKFVAGTHLLRSHF